jgi:hypothetical protein
MFAYPNWTQKTPKRQPKSNKPKPVVPMTWIEHVASPLPRECSTTELHGRWYYYFKLAKLPSLSVGAGDEVRTRDILLGRQVLYQLSYTRSATNTSPALSPYEASQHRNIIHSAWWRGKDSNLRRQSRQIYSLFPLTAREPLPAKPQIISNF